MKNYGLEKYHKKLIREAIIKSVMSGAIIGFSLMIVLSIVFYFMAFNGIWISVSIGLVITIMSAFIFKRLKYKTSIKQTARKLDSLGLEERVVTMLEFGEDEHILTQMQRTSTQDKLVHVSSKDIKFTNILKLVLSLSLVFVLAVIAVTVSTVEAHNWDKPPIIVPVDPDDEISEEDKLIEKLIEDLRRIVNNADVSQTLKDDLHDLIDNLEIQIKLDDTLAKKIARIEETRREILERIAAEKAEKTTIIDELITHDSTYDLGLALESANEDVITDYINELIDWFVALTIDEMNEFVDLFEEDIETSIEDADIKNESLAEDLRDLVALLRSLIPIVEGEEPDDVSDEVDELVEDIMESIGQETPEEALEEDIDETIQDAIDDLTGNEEDEEPTDPEDPKDPKDPEEGENGGDGEDGEGDPSPVKNPTIIDGETEFTSEQFELMMTTLRAMYESNQITDEELITIINNYMNNIEIK